MADEDDKKYWYNTTTGQVEYGMVSPLAERAGPYDTRAEAEAAPERIRANTKRWDDD